MDRPKIIAKKIEAGLNAMGWNGLVNIDKGPHLKTGL